MRVMGVCGSSEERGEEGRVGTTVMLQTQLPRQLLSTRVGVTLGEGEREGGRERERERQL